MTEYFVPTTTPHGNANQLDMLGSQETTIKVASSKVGQSEKDILATIKKLVEELQSERLHAKELRSTEDRG